MKICALLLNLNINRMNVPPTSEIGLDDYILVMKDGCFSKIRFGDLNFNNTSICESFLECVDGIGCVDSEVPVEDTPPTIADLVYNIPSGKSGNKITMQDFRDVYFDVDGDNLDRVQIVGGDTNGYTLNGNPVNVGDLMNGDDILEYDAKIQDAAYQGVLFFKAYDENNIEAV